MKINITDSYSTKIVFFFLINLHIINIIIILYQVYILYEFKIIKRLRTKFFSTTNNNLNKKSLKQQDT